MKRAVGVLIPFVILLAPPPAASAGEPITIGERLTLASKILDEDRTILVSTPRGYERSQERYPVLYLTDGEAHLTHTRGTVDFLSRNGLMPDVIIVAVGNTDRTRDLTPTRADVEDRLGRARRLPTSGGAPKFLDFFRRELIPYVDANYRTEPFRVFSGHSFGGLFGLYAFLERPTLFSAVISVSPSLRWDEALPVRQAEEFFGRRRKELRSTLFVAMANELDDEPRPNLLDRLEDALEGSALDGFDWQVMRMPDETHGSVVLRAHYWGLRKVFEPWLLPRDPQSGLFTGTVEDLEKHYADLAARVGHAVMPAELAVNLLGYEVLNQERIDDAIAVFRHNVELYPLSANVYDSLGEALERAGRMTEAYDSYARAVVNAQVVGDERLAVFTANRDRARRALDEAAP